MDKKLNPAQRRANARMAVKDAKRLLTAGLAWLDAGDAQRAAAYFEGAQGAAFDAKALLDAFHPREEAYVLGSNDPSAAPVDYTEEMGRASTSGPVPWVDSGSEVY